MAGLEPVSASPKPIQIGCYSLSAVGLEVTGRPSFAEHANVGAFIQGAVKASEWWLADWLCYGETRSDWAERVDQAIDATGLSYKRILNIRATGKIDVSRRRESVEFGLHEVVAALPPAEQSAWLERSETEGWDRAELRSEIRAARRKSLVQGQAAGLYNIDVALHFVIEAPSVDKAEAQAAKLAAALVKGADLPAAVMALKVGVARPR